MADEIGISFKNPRTQTLAGNSFATVIAFTNFDLEVIEFVKDVDGKFYGLAHIPAGYGTVTTAKVVFDIIANATTGVTTMQISTAPIADDETVNASLTSITARDVTVPGTAYKIERVTETLASVPVAGDVIVIEFFHEGTATNDTLAVNTQIVNAYMELT